MPRLTCPNCGTEFTHMGKRTAAPCPERRCHTTVPVGSLATGRDLDDERRSMSTAIRANSRRTDVE